MLGGVTNKSYYKNSVLEEGGNNIQNSMDNSQEVFLKLKPRNTTVL
jgi:hypothetical protein